jgi:hypothetical protein
MKKLGIERPVDENEELDRAATQPNVCPLTTAHSRIALQRSLAPLRDHGRWICEGPR